MQIACLDLEGVLIPEIWEAVADHTNNDELRLTTRDVADYDELMKLRMREITKEGLRYSDIQQIIAGIKPFVGAPEFLEKLGRSFQVAILSDTFYEFANQIMPLLNNPFLLCHRLSIKNDYIEGYILRQKDAKRHCVNAFSKMNYKVVAAGDSLNDRGMLESANYGVLFRAADTIKKRFPKMEETDHYDELYEYFVGYINANKP